MNISIHEDVRTLQEFYPDHGVRHFLHYEFAHRFFPQYVHENPYAFFVALFGPDQAEDPTDPTRYIQSRWAMFEERVGLVQQQLDPFGKGLQFRRVSDLSMTTHLVENHPAALVQMPLPEKGPQAFFVAAVLLASPDHTNWSFDMQARIFTVEAETSRRPSPENGGLVCEWIKEGAHRILTRVDQAEPTAFLQALPQALADSR